MEFSELSNVILSVADIEFESAASLLANYKLQLVYILDNAPIPGSYWGEPEAGVIGSTVYVRSDTPVHSLLHESCHLIVAPDEKRAQIHTNASDSQAEEDAVCYLQILLADQLPGVGRQRMMRDMDAWGYTFRLGSAQQWFNQDTEETRHWLGERGFIEEFVTVK